ncbi:MAG TPA: glycosyltransferase family 1 protein [Vicinamibacterales bacterium]|nr:glycosyltransferase family 1 protein [Vicinamibacterales bacterium]
MRIVFDGTTLTPGRTGVGYYTEHLLQHLAREVVNTGDELVVVSNKPIDTQAPLPPHVRVHDGHRFPIRIGWMQLRAQRALEALRPDVAHFTNGMIPIGSPVATVVTVHDMSLRLYPNCHPVRRLLLNRPLMHVAIRQASSIVTVSNSARRDLLRLHGVAPDRVAVVHEAASPAFRPIADREWLENVRARYALPRQFMLYVGTIEPRKNLSRLMSAFADARKAGIPHHLVCVGPYGWSSRNLAGHIERLGIQDVVHFTGYVPFEHLPAIYNLGEFFAFPSLYEGFGLPVVEAMACGIPVLTSTTSSLGEIAGDAAETIDPADTDAIADAIVRLASDQDLRRDRAERGLRRARSFSWAQTARDMLAVYHRAAGVTLKAPSPVALAKGEAADQRVPVKSMSRSRLS